MKKVRLYILIALAATAFTFTACKKGSEHKAEEQVNDETGDGIRVEEGDASNDEAVNSDTSSTAHVHYACPMACEGDKKYDENVPCPVCGMELKEVKHEGH